MFYVSPKTFLFLILHSCSLCLIPHSSFPLFPFPSFLKSLPTPISSTPFPKALPQFSSPTPLPNPLSSIPIPDPASRSPSPTYILNKARIESKKEKEREREQKQENKKGFEAVERKRTGARYWLWRWRWHCGCSLLHPILSSLIYSTCYGAAGMRSPQTRGQFLHFGLGG